MRRWPCLGLLLFVCLVVLAACGPSRQERQAALNQFIGQPETAVVQRFGVPNRTFETGGVRFLAYDERRLAYAPGAVGFGPFYGYGYGWYGYAAVPPPMVERLCETTFEIGGGVVRQVSLRGDSCGY